MAAIAMGAVAILLVLSQGGVFSAWALDWLWSLNGPFQTFEGQKLTIGDQVVIAAVDEKSLREYRGNRPRLPRAIYTRVIDALISLEARLIGFDVTFDEPGDPEEDRLLREIVRRSGRVVTNCFLANNEDFSRIWITGRAFFRDAARGEGFADFPLDLDRDRFIRRVRHFYGRGDLPCRVSFALALYLADIRATPREVIPGDGWLQIPRPAGFKPVRLPLDHRGLSLVGFLGGAGSLPSFSIADLLEGRVPAERVRDKIVLIGGTAAEFRDSFHTPFARLGEMPGVELHGHLLENLFAGKALRELSGPFWWFLLLPVAGLVAVLVARFRPLPTGAGCLVLGGLAVPVALWLFTARGVFINPLDLWAALGLSWIAATALDVTFLHQEKTTISRLFHQYVSPNLLQELLEKPETLALGGSRRQAVVLFADIRGFTLLCEDRPPETVIRFLNTYFQAVSHEVFAHGGVVDKYMGDGMMAFFGVPLPHAGDIERAVLSALAMQRRIAELRRSEGDFPIEGIGIGLHGGDVVAGNVGSELHREYTLLGDVVNVTARLESMCRKGEVLVSGWMRDRLPEGRFLLEPRGPLKVKGRRGEIETWAVLGEYGK